MQRHQDTKPQNDVDAKSKAEKLRNLKTEIRNNNNINAAKKM